MNLCLFTTKLSSSRGHFRPRTVFYNINFYKIAIQTQAKKKTSPLRFINASTRRPHIVLIEKDNLSFCVL